MSHIVTELCETQFEPVTTGTKNLSAVKAHMRFMLDGH